MYMYNVSDASVGYKIVHLISLHSYNALKPSYQTLQFDV